jgi:hypothetical protein
MVSTHVGRVVAGHWITEARRWAIWARDGLACVYCGVSLEEGARLTLDHVRPRSHGGSHASTNLVTACVHCNSVRAATSIQVFCEHLRSLAVPSEVIETIPDRVLKATQRPVDLARGRALAAAAKAGKAWGFARYIKG